jgi:uncharacterized protein YceH (UPF0502 family)
MQPMDSQAALSDALAPLLANGRVRRLDPLPGSRAERYAQTIAANAQPMPGAQPTPGTQSAAAPAPAPARLEVQAELEKRVAELEETTARLRRQLDHLAWSLGKKLEG